MVNDDAHLSEEEILLRDEKTIIDANDLIQPPEKDIDIVKLEMLKEYKDKSFPPNAQVKDLKQITELKEEQIFIFAMGNVIDKTNDIMGLGENYYEEFDRDFLEFLISKERKGRNEINEMLKIAKEPLKEEIGEESRLKRLFRGGRY